MKFYRCSICGKIIAMVDGNKRIPTICCNREMDELIPNTEDGAVEKHVPVVEVLENNVVHVKVGSADHPMIDTHYVQWIVLITDKGNQRKVLNPGDKPEAYFALLKGEKVIEALEYCNLHGLYSSKK